VTRDADLNFSDLITLDDACKHFLGGKVTVATLRALHKDEKLEIYRIGRRDFTTISDLKAMQQKCRVEAPVRNSGSTRRGRQVHCRHHPGQVQGLHCVPRRQDHRAV